jgi:hypothetical protein
MSQTKSASYYSNSSSVEAACLHCKAYSWHEHWCLTLNPTVRYAYEIVFYPGKLTAGDTIILHSLGVLWSARP